MTNCARIPDITWAAGSHVPQPDSIAITAEEVANIYTAIGRLPPAQLAVMLMHIDGLSHREIAAIRNTSTATSRVLLHRARATLRTILS